MPHSKKAIITNFMGTLSGKETDGRFINYLMKESMEHYSFGDSDLSKRSSPNSMEEVNEAKDARRDLNKAKIKILDETVNYKNKRDSIHRYLEDGILFSGYLTHKRPEGLETNVNNLEQIKEELEGLEEIQKSMIETYNDLVTDKVSKDLIEKKTREYVERRRVQSSLQKEMLQTFSKLNEEGHYTGIITPSYAKEVKDILEASGYLDAFDEIMGSELIEGNKTYGFTHVGSEEKEEFMREIIKEAKVEKEDVVTIVDDFMEAPLIESSGKSFISPFSKREKNWLLYDALRHTYKLEEIPDTKKLKPEELVQKLAD